MASKLIIVLLFTYFSNCFSQYIFFYNKANFGVNCTFKWDELDQDYNVAFRSIYRSSFNPMSVTRKPNIYTATNANVNCVNPLDMGSGVASSDTVSLINENDTVCYWLLQNADNSIRLQTTTSTENRVDAAKKCFLS